MAHRQATLPLFFATNTMARLYSDARVPARFAPAALAPMQRAIVTRLMDVRNHPA